MSTLGKLITRPSLVCGLSRGSSAQGSIKACSPDWSSLGFPGGASGKNLPSNAGLIPGSWSCPGGGCGNHSNILAWRIPWAEEPGAGLWSIGSHVWGWASQELTYRTEAFRISLKYRRYFTGSLLKAHDSFRNTTFGRWLCQTFR